MRERIEQFQNAMKEQNIDAMVVRLPENVVMFSQYWPRNGFSFVFIPAEGDACLICPEAEYSDAMDGSISCVRTFGWVRLKDGDPYTNVASVLRELAKQNGLTARSVIGVEMGMDTLAPPLCAGESGLPGKKTLSAIQSGLGSENIVRINDLIDSLRSIKFKPDIKKLQLANFITREGIRHFDTIINQPNIREIDVAASIESHIARFASGFKGCKYARAFAQVSSGRGTADAWYAGVVSSPRVLKYRDFVMLEIGVVVDGYWCDLTQTGCVGGMDGRKAELYSAVMQAQSDAVMEVRAGVKAKDVDAVARKTLQRAGYDEYFIHHTGHGVGFAYHEAKPMLAPSSEDTLEVGQVFSVEPGIYIPDFGGVRLECNVLVTEEGRETLGIARCD